MVSNKRRIGHDEVEPPTLNGEDVSESEPPVQRAHRAVVDQAAVGGQPHDRLSRRAHRRIPRLQRLGDHAPPVDLPRHAGLRQERPERFVQGVSAKPRAAGAHVEEHSEGRQVEDPSQTGQALLDVLVHRPTHGVGARAIEAPWQPGDSGRGGKREEVGVVAVDLLEQVRDLLDPLGDERAAGTEQAELTGALPTTHQLLSEPLGHDGLHVLPEHSDERVAALDVGVEERQLGSGDLLVGKPLLLGAHREEPERQLAELDGDRADVDAVAAALHDVAQASDQAALDR